jgi:three-Cys-motif partner protein
MDNFEWLKDKVIRLAGAKQEVAGLYEKVQKGIYVKGPWAFWKLVILAFYIDIFTVVAKKNRQNIVYVDLLAGPGFDYIEDFDLVIAGSPLLAKIMPRVLKSGSVKAFNRMVLSDTNSEYCASLREIVTADVLCTDCNSDEVYDAIVSAMSPPGSLLLAFVDPEGLDVQWRTMERLFELPGDFVINYPYYGVGRLCASYEATSDQTKQSTGILIDNFFGTHDWSEIECGTGIAERLYGLYLNRLKEHRSEVVEFPIMMIGGAQYRILVATRKTSTGSPWLQPVLDLRNRIQSISDGELGILVSIYKGNQTQLTDFQ